MLVFATSDVNTKNVVCSHWVVEGHHLGRYTISVCMIVHALMFCVATTCNCTCRVDACTVAAEMHREIGFAIARGVVDVARASRVPLHSYSCSPFGGVKRIRHHARLNITVALSAMCFGMRTG